jgi:signal transduction histidine kinase
MEIEYPEFQSLPYRWNWFYKPVFVDVDKDGINEIIVRLKAFYEGYPRGAACFDPKSGKRLWTYYAGTQFESMIIEDLDRDGSMEIIISTFAANNGADLNGTSDAYSYIIVLDSNGNELWKKKTGDWYTRAYSVVSDVDHDGICEIVSGTECHRAHAETKGKIYIFKGTTGEEKASFPVPDASCSKPVVLNCEDRKTRIYVSDSSGRLRAFDKNLNCLKTVTENSPLGLLYACTGTNARQYIFAATTNKILAYDRDLEGKIFEYNFGYSPTNNDILDFLSLFIPFHTKEGVEAFVVADKLYRIRESKRNFFFILKNGVTTHLFFTAFILVLFNGLFIYFFFHVKKNGFRSTSMKRKYAPENLQHLEIIQEIAHQLKNPISTILWTAEKLKRSNENNALKKNAAGETYVELADFLTDDVNSLRLYINNILKLIQIQEPRFCETNLKSLLQNLSQSHRFRSLADGQIITRLEIPADFTLIADEDLIKEAITNLLDNSDAVLPEEKNITLSVVPRVSFFKRNTKEVSITLEGIYSNIEKKDKSQNIAMFICRRILEIHGGRIKLISRKGTGTKVTVTLPMAGRKNYK